MYWVINGCCDLVQLFRWMITQSHRNCKELHESQSQNIGIWEFPLQFALINVNILTGLCFLDAFISDGHILKQIIELIKVTWKLPWL